MSFFSVQNMYKSFGELDVIRDLSFDCEKQERIGIVGPSGSGKSVLLKLIADVFQADSGSILWGNRKDTEENNPPAIGFLFQEGALFDSMTVEENVLFPLLAKRTSYQSSTRNTVFDGDREKAKSLASEMLGFVGLGSALEKYPSELSGGMRKRAGIARALVHSPELLLLDDPTSGLDPITANTIMNLIERLAEERKCTVIMVSHDIRRLIPRVQRIIMLEKGEILSDCPTSNLLKEAPEATISFLKTRYDFQNEQEAR
jgi:phospholipid/cholesterol/gamma-HCH transport system ATP-binding protein